MKICTVVVTYNRYNLLKECLDALLNQTYKTDILLVDNASTDGTDNKIKEDGYLKHSNLIYRRLESNLGGAGGFHFGVKYALENNYDFVWLMDDDAEPELDCLELLMTYTDKAEYSAFAPSLYVGDKTNGVLNITGGHRGVFDYTKPLPSFQKPIDKTEYEKELCKIDMASFVGILIPISSVEKIGLPRDDFFIHHDDVEYSLRLSKIGKILMVTKSKIYHKEKRQEEKYLKRFWIFEKNRIKFEVLWLKYFGMRNSIYLALQYGQDKLIIPKVLWSHLLLIKDILIYDDNKIKRILFATNSIFDGLRGHFDNTKAKKILGK
ncbi:MAG: glycosyltransferase family 2 protein [Campylobacterota bacterium]